MFIAYKFNKNGWIEIYDKQGKYQGLYNPKTKEKKPPVKSRKVKKWNLSQKLIFALFIIINLMIVL